MKPSTEKIYLRDYESANGRGKEAYIEIANGNKGGIPTWIEPGPNTRSVSSIRRYVYDENGKFDIHSSPELPIDDLVVFITEGAKDDVFTRGQCIEMIEHLINSIKRI